MGLVDYSDSENSDSAERIITKPVAARQPAAATASKPTFQKVVDRSNPHKIRVTLPIISEKLPIDDEADGEGPPAKRTKVGSGAFNGFNSFLPAPKRAAQAGPVDGSRGADRKKGLGSGVNLKTGAAPGFSREAEPTMTVQDDDYKDGGGRVSQGNGTIADTTQSATSFEIVETQVDEDKPTAEPKKIGTSTMFRPLSVARKPQKKIKAVRSPVAPVISPSDTVVKPKVAPKVSLFSMGPEQTSSVQPSSSNGHYKPMIYEPFHTNARSPSPTALSDPQFVDEEDIAAPEPAAPETSTPDGPQSINNIASDLNLSESAMRQLFGRQRGTNRKQNMSDINIVNFNTDQEYAANELLRQAGETVQHNPVKAIAPGKHNLKQLVNAASSQKEALEEQFMSGRRNKKEAGSKYGW
ncbi:MAG: hypothetical protein M1827_002645 [Pycnora praestabilis]|nr:MAG: hypothetical protein M1827_002645 [Pycnora praestabilis]